jgi:hypothetical protein
VPGLFSAEELAKELAPLEALRSRDGAYGGPATGHAYFLHRVRQRLRVVVCLDPAHELFRARLAGNPALLARCSVHWLDGWSREGMVALAADLLQPAMAASNEDDDAGLVEQTVAMHGMAGPAATPRHFAAFVALYARVFAAKRKQLLAQQKFLRGGLQKLSEAAATVDGLSRRAETQRAALTRKQAEADAALTRITASMEQAADRRKEVEVLRARLEGSQGEIKRQRGAVPRRRAAPLRAPRRLATSTVLCAPPASHH